MKWLSYAASGLYLSILFSCSSDDAPPPLENEEEVITTVTLTFEPEGGGEAVTASWEDADGEGAGVPVVDNIILAPDTEYTLSITLTNAIDPDSPEDITEEVRTEADEHMFFFGWTEGLMADPSGDGNIDDRADPVNYEDSDGTLPLGLITRWTTGQPATGVPATGTFRLLLKHQPDIKSATSTSGNGETDVNIEWEMTIQ